MTELNIERVGGGFIISANWPLSGHQKTMCTDGQLLLLVVGNWVREWDEREKMRERKAI